ncbi:N-acyl amino acid synthase FeeM domain-containing protein [Parachitinimonas caeni]|uniref:N-acetyltransferase n=1 Tax=Parachitinimonas caeni TaxID=3031301 RepID=A0ABT7E3G2_9NEIS|nr:N-acetyltransferase [Parachitinimonas caeni]MDK2126845.1 N-acetyltransferase [Parachitinimonas caeni]
MNTIVGIPYDSERGIRHLCHEAVARTASPAHLVPQKSFKIRLADSDGRRSAASMLISKMYAWRGYTSSGRLDLDPNRVTLLASDGERTIGTLSIHFDSAQGLLVEQLFREQVDPVRQRGRRVCEFVKLAIDGEIKSKRVLAALFHISLIYAYRLRRHTDLFIEVNPRHVRFYQQMLDFSRLGEPQLNPRVNAPAVLLWKDLIEAHQQAQQFGGRPELAAVEKSFYPYFFSPDEEQGIANRLLQMDMH